jgi:anti-sigma factor (TIGR02949 family)
MKTEFENHHNCHQILTQFSSYIDGDLPETVCQELEKHLQECKNCTIVLNTMQKTIELYQQSTETEHLPDEVRQRLFYMLNLNELLDETSEGSPQ